MWVTTAARGCRGGMDGGGGGGVAATRPDERRATIVDADVTTNQATGGRPPCRAGALSVVWFVVT